MLGTARRSRGAHLVAAAALVLAAGCGRGGTPGTAAEGAGAIGTAFTVSVARPSNGVVTSTDGQLRCGPAAADTLCKASFPWTTRVTLAAAPDAGWIFQNWAGDCTLSPCVLDTSRSGADKYVVAVFVRPAELAHPNWSRAADHAPGYFAFLGGKPLTPQCPSCHGANLQGVGIAPGCFACHRQAGWTGDWRGNCSFCHGARDSAAKAGYAFAEHPAWAAPPGALSERLGGPAAPGRTGAHQAHLLGVTAGGLRVAPPFRCETCHPVRERHASGDRAEVVLSGAGQASLPATLGSYDPASGTCATYCHGPARPAWSGAVQCGGCHALPPAVVGHPAADPAPQACAPCHRDTVRADGTIDLAGGKHLDGAVQAVRCGGCHALPPDAGAHAAHYGLAPEEAPVGYGDVRVLQDRFPLAAPAGAPDRYAFGCGSCHPIDGARHADGTVQLELAGTAAPAGSMKALNAADAAYDPQTGTCSGVYCHSSGQASPAYVTTPGWRSGAAPGCAGCHENPPRYASGGAGAATANGHVNLADDGWEFGHYGGLIGPWLYSRHGLGGGTDAAPITCQTCHADTVDPANAGPSGFYYLDTTGTYELPGGDPDRVVLQCTRCHFESSPFAPVQGGKVLPLRHVNGTREVVFDGRETLPELAWLPPEPSRPVRPYWMTDAGALWSRYGTDAVMSGGTVSFSLARAAYDPPTKTCTNVACHLAEDPRWGAPYQFLGETCSACHPDF